jgi:Lon protease-like protein
MTASSSSTRELPLFPLQSVLFPDGLLSLKVFEARYLDLIGTCMREQRPFGVVALKRGQEVKRAGDAVELETIGCQAELIDVDSPQSGILQVRCRGTVRFETHASRQQPNGLWVGDVSDLPDDEAVLPTEELVGTAKGLANAIAALKRQGVVHILEPYRFESAGWVANRWCELLPISVTAKQKLMELPDPLVRLKLVDEFLRSKGVVT